MKRRIVALVLATATVATAVAGCGSKKSTDKKNNIAATLASTPDGETPTEAETKKPVEPVKLTVSVTDFSEYVTMGEYKGLTVEVSSAEVTEEQMQEAIKNVLEDGTTYEQVKDRVVADKDTINFDFTGYYMNEDGSKGEAFDRGAATNFEYKIGGNFIKDLNDQLIGLECDKEYDLKCTFPEDYDSPDLKGQTVIFTVLIHYINGDAIEPEWTDDFCKEYSDGKYATTEEYEKVIKDSLAASNLNEQDTEFKNNVVSTIVNNFKVSEYPEDRLNEIYESMYGYYKDMYEHYAEYYNMSYDELMESYGLSDDQLQKDCMDQSKTQLQYIMVMSTIAIQENIEITEAEYNEAAISYLESTGYESIEAFEKDYGQQYLFDSFLSDKVCSKLYEWNSLKVTKDKKEDK